MKFLEDKQINMRKSEAVHVLLLIASQVPIVALKNMAMRHVAHCSMPIPSVHEFIYFSHRDG